MIQALQPHFHHIEAILDWFHIGKKFQTVLNALGVIHEESLENAKWKLWHGQATEALEKLEMLRKQITDHKQKNKLKGLQDSPFAQISNSLIITMVKKLTLQGFQEM